MNVLMAVNTNPNAKVIVCYGDSNTWGVNPLNGQRYPANKRWPGVLQQTLGMEYAVIEEGLSGRTTMYSDASQPMKNGKAFFLGALSSHAPLDLLIVMLGTNDVKVKYAVDDSAIGMGMEDLMQIVHTARAGRNNGEPKTLIVAPPLIQDIAARQDEGMVDGPRKSALFAARYQAVAERNNCLFLNAADIVQASETDGYHLDESAHQTLGKALAELIKTVL
jgi:lysophospholipase L1-like esterase